MPNKVTTPAVSQLAGEIDVRCPKCGSDDLVLWRAPKTIKDVTCITCEAIFYITNIEDFWQFFSAALSEREEKIANVESAAKNLLAVLPKSAALIERVGGFVKELDAALSALGESKDHFLDSK